MNEKIEQFDAQRLKYLNLLAKQYPNINSACTEIINLQAILNLPKGTEHFVSDVHGAYEAFNHVLRNGSGAIKRKLNEVFGTTLLKSEKKSLATLIYYPEEKLRQIKKDNRIGDIMDWYKITLVRLIKACREVSTKYTRSKVRKALPKEFSYIIEELMQESEENQNKYDYYLEIIDTIISLGQAEQFIIAISNVIHRLAIDRLHVIGDIYDRGKDACGVMEILKNYHSLDIQWGNHDISWMGAAAGSEALICNVLRISARYANLETVEEDYGINLVPLVTFALECYRDDPCEAFLPRVSGDESLSHRETALISKIHKAISIMQFKLEAQIIKKHPEFNMEKMLLLDKIDFEHSTVMVGDNCYKLTDCNFPTVDSKCSFELTEEEREVMDKLKTSFLNAAKLQEHVNLLFKKGSLYLTYNDNLLFHGCIPLDEDGGFKKVNIGGRERSGKELFDFMERKTREAYFGEPNSEGKQEGLDFIWYLWCGPYSPLFGKLKITTFERYFIDDKAAHVEQRNAYYTYRNNEEICNKIFDEFGLPAENAHIVNGHVPVKAIKGEQPIKANGKLYVIDGGFSKAYQKVTGIAGYTLIYNSYSLMLVAHQPFESIDYAVKNEIDIHSTTVSSEFSNQRKFVKDTDNGKLLRQNIDDLKELVIAYRKGVIIER